MDRLLSIMRAALADARARGALDEYACILLGIARLQHMSDLATMTTAHMPVVRQEESVAA